MGVMSSLALVLIPLLRRDSSTTLPIDSETKRLKAELAEARAEIERLRLDVLHWMDFADTVRRSTPLPAPIHQINEAMRQQIEAQMQAMAQYNSQANQMLAQQAPYQQGLGLQAQMQNWHVCNCTPPHGRAGYLLGDGS